MIYLSADSPDASFFFVLFFKSTLLLITLLYIQIVLLSLRVDWHYQAKYMSS